MNINVDGSIMRPVIMFVKWIFCMKFFELLRACRNVAMLGGTLVLLFWAGVLIWSSYM